MTRVILLQLPGAGLVNFQTVIVKEFFARRDRANGINENTIAFLDRFAIRRAGMINPTRIISPNLGIDDIFAIC